MTEVLDDILPLQTLSVRQTARVLQIREAKVREEIHRGVLKAARIGRQFRIRPHQVEEYLEALATHR